MAYHTLNGRDPRTTVYYSGFREKYIRQLYITTIKELFIGHLIDEDTAHTVKVSFDDNSEKVFVTFGCMTKNPRGEEDWVTRKATIPGRIITDVYKAVKMRKLQMPGTIKVLRYVSMNQ